MNVHRFLRWVAAILWTLTCCVSVPSGQARLRKIPSTELSSIPTLTAADLSYVGAYKFEDISGGTAFTDGNVTLDGSRLFITGARNQNDLLEFTLNAAAPDTNLATAPVNAFVRKWPAAGGDFTEGRRLVTSGEDVFTWGILFERVYDPQTAQVQDCIFWSYSAGYSDDGTNPQIGATVLYQDGTIKTYGPWRMSVASNMANSSMFRLPTDMAASIGKTHAIHGSVHSQAQGSPVGASLYAFNLPALDLAASTHGGAIGINVLTMFQFTIANPQMRLTVPDYKLCYFRVGAAQSAGHGTLAAAAHIGDTTLSLTDVTYFAVVGSQSNWSPGNWAGYAGADFNETGSVHIDYTGKSTSTGPGLLTGVTVGATPNFTAELSAGAPVYPNNYDTLRGGDFAPDPNSTFRNIVGGEVDGRVHDWIDRFTMIDVTGAHPRRGFFGIGNLGATIPGYDYGMQASSIPPNEDRLTSETYRYESHRFYVASDGWCPHGQWTGPDASYMWIYPWAGAVEVALGSRTTYSVPPSQEFPSSIVGMSAIEEAIRKHGEIIHDTARNRILIVEKGQVGGDKPVLRVLAIAP